MADISMIEWIVYGLFAYSSAIILAISTQLTPPMQRSLSIVRTIWMIPGMIAAFFLATTGENIAMLTIHTNSTTISNVTKEAFSEVTTQTNFFALQNPVWLSFHLMLGLVLGIYIMMQLVALFTSKD